MTKATASSNGKARPPDLERWGSQGPQSQADRIEHYLSNGASRSLDEITAISGAEGKAAYTSTSRTVRTMIDAGLVSEMPNALDARKRVYRWKYFEIEQPTPKGPKIPEWMECDPDQHVIPSNPPGWRTRWARRWIRVRGKRIWEELPSRPPADKTDEELQWHLEDVCLHSGNKGTYLNGAPGHRRPGEVFGNELLGRINIFGGFEPGMRNAVYSWLGARADALPLAVWPPECFVLSHKGYHLHPLVVDKLHVVTAVPGMMPQGCWQPPDEIVRAVVSQAANIWRSKTFVT